jgi:hypothetical protein
MLRVIGSLIAGKDDVQMRLCCFLLKPLLIELGMKELAEVVSNETIKVKLNIIALKTNSKLMNKK